MSFYRNESSSVTFTIKKNTTMNNKQSVSRARWSSAGDGSEPTAGRSAAGPVSVAAAAERSSRSKKIRPRLLSREALVNGFTHWYCAAFGIVHPIGSGDNAWARSATVCMKRQTTDRHESNKA